MCWTPGNGWIMDNVFDSLTSRSEDDVSRLMYAKKLDFVRKGNKLDVCVLKYSQICLCDTFLYMHITW